MNFHSDIFGIDREYPDDFFTEEYDHDEKYTAREKLEMLAERSHDCMLEYKNGCVACIALDAIAHQGENDDEWLLRNVLDDIRSIRHDWWECPYCGWMPPEDAPPKEVSNYRSTYAMAMICSGAAEWDETWHCPICEEDFTYTNANY